MLNQVVATLALGSRPRQRGCKVVGQEEGSPGVKAKALQDYKPRERKHGSQGKGFARLQAKKIETRESRQGQYKGAGQEEARESHHILPGMQGSARECEGVNTRTPKATPTLGEGVPVDFQSFRERFEGSKLNGLWRSLYQWKALGT
jgi:hypothetical protein